MFENEAKLGEAINNLKTYVPVTLIPGEACQELLNITEIVPTVNVEDHIKKLQEFYFHKNDSDCSTTCKMAKVRHYLLFSKLML